MKEFLAGWIVIQLLVIGFANGIAVWMVDNKVCPEEANGPSLVSSMIIGTILPLAAFAHDTDFSYCEVGTENIKS